MEKRNDFKSILPLVFRAVGLAMGVAAIVLNILKVAPLETQVLLLSFGLFGLGIAVLDKEDGNER